MQRVNRDAALAEQAVQKIARGEHKPAKRRYRKGPPPDPVFGVERRDVHPAVWQAALKAAKGDTRRITVVSRTEVHVR